MERTPLDASAPPHDPDARLCAGPAAAGPRRCADDGCQNDRCCGQHHGRARADRPQAGRVPVASGNLADRPDRAGGQPG
ncbi:hypothetical protein G6F62_015552 [Rhizopus arrhizus]|nr:hypothetical protein G6F62_015552 [Rhizopus arrhizus]